jgi:hypothetical protein
MRTTDMEAVSRIFNHPKVYEWVSDDTSVPPYVPDPNHLYLMNEEKTGAVRIDQLNGITCMVHIGALPELWGRATSFVKEGVTWVFENTPYTKIVSFAPECNRTAVFFGKRCGFKIEGKVTKSFLKDWKLHDQVVFGLSKYDEEELCQQQQE